MNETKKREDLKKVFSTKKKDEHTPPCKCSGNEVTKSKGEVIIYATRTGFSLPFSLPYCIFGTLYLQNFSFAQVIQNYLPPGITVNVIFDLNALIFSFTDGLTSDNITVTSPDISLISYAEMLTNLNTNYLRTNYVLFDCNAADDAEFLDQTQIKKLQGGGLFLQNIGAGGHKDVQLIIPKTRINGVQSVPNIINLDMRNEPIKPETVWIHSIANPVTPAPGVVVKPIVFSFTVFISERINMNSEKINFHN